MNDTLVAIRALHFGASAITAGVVVFLVLVAGPALRSASADRAVREYRLRIVRLAATALAVAVLSGSAWLVIEAARMSGRPLAAALGDGVLSTVLTRTTFGIACNVRFGFAALLAAALALLGSHRWATWSAPMLAAALLGTLAWTGHAAAGEGLEGDIHIAADAVHLVAAGTWLGSLIALAMLLATAIRKGNQTWHEIARTAVIRFSTLGMVTVSALLASGILNSWMLAGTLPALLGTDYGRLLLIKIALFGAMLAVAAVNRLQLTPRLSQPLAAAFPAGALRQLTCNSLIEVALGLIIFVLVGALGTLPPGVHTQPSWPLPFRFDAAILGDPIIGQRVLIAIIATALSVALIVGGLGWRALRWPMIIAGTLTAAYFGRGLGPLFAEAYPTSFYVSPTGYSGSSIVQGRQLFAQHCAACHGETGRGDGPAATAQRTRADLVSGHIYVHRHGDLFWWIAHGLGDAMPGFAGILDEAAIWSVIDFVRANADGVRLAASGGAVSRAGYPAPSFTAQCPDGSTLSLDELRGRVIHLIAPSSEPTEQIPRLAERVTAAEVTTILVARHGEFVPDGALCVADDKSVAEVLAIYRGKNQIDGTELLIDEAGNLRALWHPGVRWPQWTNAKDFKAAVDTIRRTPAVLRSTAPHLHR